MSDDLQKKGAADRSRVNVNEPWEVQYWCKKLGCTEQELRSAVDRVGPMAEDVERSLRKSA